MHQPEFAAAVEHLIATDPRYHRDAYYFIRDALDHTVKLRKRQLGEGGHVTGQQICEGARQVALKNFGPMAPTVLEYWGLGKTEDFGEIVWAMIDLGVWGKSDTDSKRDFRGVYSFHDAFVAPWLPAEMPVRALRPKAVARVRQ